MKRSLICLVCLLSFLHGRAQVIQRVEYYFNTDPGFGNAVNVPVPADSIITNFVFNVDLSALSAGLHTLYLRSKDLNGKWSATNQQFVYKFPPLNTAGASVINQLEYYFDTDPGFGNGLNVPLGADSTINGFLFNADLSSLSTGLHAMYIRSRDASGKWSMTNQQFVYKFPPLNASGTSVINQLEYYFDTDPGFGNGLNVPLGADSTINGFLFNADLSSLSTGLHAMYIRSRDASGKWSMTNQQFVYKFPPLNASGTSLIDQLEYYFDTDPGFGNGLNVPLSVDSTINGFLFNADLSSLSTGLHAMYIRSRDASGKWSVTNQQFVYKFPPLNGSGTSLINQLEYYFDTDPGFGNGLNVPLGADSTINGFLFNADLSSLSTGLHAMYIRSRDTSGKWSMTNQQFVYKFPPLNTTGTSVVNKLEYYFDTDPGFGNAINVPLSADSTINGFLFNADLNSLSTGLHAMYIRSRDANGKWSMTNQQFVYKFPPLSPSGSSVINKLEYYFDADPGFGYALNVPLGADSTINGFLFNADLSGLSTGLHAMYIRSQDANGKWSTTNQQFVYKFPPLNLTGTSAINTVEYYFDTDPGFGNGNPVALNPDSVLNNLWFNVDLSSLSNGLHVMFVRSRDANGKWSETNQQYIYKYKAVNTSPAPAITRLEYFVDTDPGRGNGISLPIPSDSVLSDISFSLDTSGLSYGAHVLYVRSKDANGNWSLVNMVRFSRDNLKLFLQGYYTGTNTMAATLFNQGISNDLSLTDTIEVELHNITYPYAFREKATALLKTDGTAACTFMNVYGSFYIVVKHRNAITTWSTSPVAIGNFQTTYDFSTAANKAYGNNQKAMGGGVWAIYAGDIDRDENVDLLDASLQENDIRNFQFGYFSSDINGDGNVDLLDSPVLEMNLTNFIYSVHP